VAQTKAQLVVGLNVNASAPASALQIDASGNVNLDSNTLYVDATNNRVGVGISSPGNPLEVVGAIETSGSSNAVLFAGSSSTPTIGAGIHKPADDSLAIVTGSTERLRIDSSGRVGIGTSTVDGNVHIADGTRANLILKKTGLNDVTNSSLHTAYDVIQLGAGGSLASYNVETATADTHVGHNFYRHSGGNFRYKYTDAAARIRFNSTQGAIIFDRAAEGTANTDVTFSESMRIDSSGRLGIGTTSPSQKLHVVGQALFNNGSDFYINAASEVARFDSSGRLLVGTSSVDSINTHQPALYVKGDTYSKSTVGITSTSNNSEGSYLFFAKSRNSSGTPTVLASGDIIGHIRFSSYDGSDWDSFAGSIECIVDGTPGINDMPGRLVFSTTLDGASSPTERMRITNSGDVLINAITSYGKLTVVGATSNNTANAFNVFDSTGVALLTVRNDGRIVTGTSTSSPYNLTTASAANVHCDSNGILYRSTSSLKYKKNVADSQFGLQELLALRPVTYQSKSEADGETTYGGLIAEEVHNAGLSEFVQYAEDGSPDALAYGNMVSLCIKAIQEQQAMIVELQAKVAALESA